MGIPDEILTDQGTNLTSHLVQLFYKQLRVGTIFTMQYHPQTNGLLEKECYGSSLTTLERIGIVGCHSCFSLTRCHKPLPGFFPFELLYGWDVQGPIYLLQKSWGVPEPSAKDRAVVQFVGSKIQPQVDKVEAI